MADFIDSLDQITPQWLGAALTESGLLTDGEEVVDVSYQLIGTGKMGDNARLSIQYAAPTSAPASIVAKVPSADETARSVAGGMGAYRKEVMFYRELAPLTTMKTPVIYVSLLSDDGTSFMLLMEDMAPAAPGDNTGSASRQQTELALVEAAKLHASFYNNPVLEGKDYLTRNDPEGTGFGQALLQQSWPGFLDRFAAGLSQECIDFGTRYVDCHQAWACGYDGPQTLVHGDFRAENLLFSDNSVTAIDWQTVACSSGMADVAYFLGGSLNAEDRRGCEKAMVEAYRKELAANGVERSEQECWERYRRFSIHGLLVTILGASFSEPDERGDKMFQTMIQRHLQHCVDLGASEFLS